MKKVVMFVGIIALLFLASCATGPGRATGTLTTKVMVGTNPMAAGVIMNICSATYPNNCEKTTGADGKVTFDGVPIGATKVTATGPFGTLSKSVTVKEVQAPRAFVVVMQVGMIVDTDGDGVVDGIDNCPSVPNADQLNIDRDKKGDVCDEDDDNDGIADGPDPCDVMANVDAENCFVTLVSEKVCQSVNSPLVAFGSCSPCIDSQFVSCVNVAPCAYHGDHDRGGASNIMEFKIYRAAKSVEFKAIGGEAYKCTVNAVYLGGSTASYEVLNTGGRNTCWVQGTASWPAAALMPGKYTVNCWAAGGGEKVYVNFYPSLFRIHYE